MKKFDWNHPVTRKDYAVLCGWSFGICIAIYTVAIVVTYWDNIKTWAKRKVEKLNQSYLGVIKTIRVTETWPFGFRTKIPFYNRNIE